MKRFMTKCFIGIQFTNHNIFRSVALSLFLFITSTQSVLNACAATLIQRLWFQIVKCFVCVWRIAHRHIGSLHNTSDSDYYNYTMGLRLAKRLSCHSTVLFLFSFLSLLSLLLLLMNIKIFHYVLFFLTTHKCAATLCAIPCIHTYTVYMIHLYSRCRNRIFFSYLIYLIWRRRFIQQASFFFSHRQYYWKACAHSNPPDEQKKANIHFCLLLSHNK